MSQWPVLQKAFGIWDIFICSMPIDINSEDWPDRGYIDYAEIEIQNFLSSNDDKAYRVEEIGEHLVKNEPQVFPNRLIGGEKEVIQSRIAFVAVILEKLNWLQRIEMKEVEGELYYSYNEGESRHPLPEIKYDLPEAIEEVEENTEKDIQDLENRIERIEFRVREELGYL